MHKIFAIAVVGLFFLAAIPGVQAETKTAEYDVPSGPNGNRGAAISTRLLAPEWDSDWWCLEDDDVCEEVIDPVTETAFPAIRSAVGRENTGVLNIGVYSAAIEAATDSYTDFQVTVTDTLPAQTFFVFCIITNHADGREGSDTWCGEEPGCDADPTLCDDIVDPEVAQCGSASLTSDVPAGGPENGPTAFVYATFVDETTGNVCLGSSGSLTVTFS